MATNQILIIATDSWVSNALSSDLTLLAAGIGLVCLILIALLLRATLRIGRVNRASSEQSSITNDGSQPSPAGESDPSFVADTSATTSLEFTLVLPILLFAVLMLVQSMMLMAGNMFVHHAAYWATRQAVLEVPMNYDGNGGLEANLVSNSENSEKYERIHLVAALRLMPVAGRQDSGNAPSDQIVTAVRNHFAAYGQNEPAWVETMLAPKANYAFEHTKIEVMNTRINPVNSHDVIFEPLPTDPFKFGVRDPITVVLTHHLNLGVPIVSRVFADGEHDGSGPGRYATVHAQYTLTNEGVTVPLPEKPEVDRITPDLPELPPGENEDPNNPIVN